MHVAHDFKQSGCLMIDSLWMLSVWEKVLRTLHLKTAMKIQKLLESRVNVDHINEC